MLLIQKLGGKFDACIMIGQVLQLNWKSLL